MREKGNPRTYRGTTLYSAPVWQICEIVTGTVNLTL
jgi:hypothetical protein